MLEYGEGCECNIVCEKLHSFENYMFQHFDLIQNYQEMRKSKTDVKNLFHATNLKGIQLFKEKPIEHSLQSCVSQEIRRLEQLTNKIKERIAQLNKMYINQLQNLISDTNYKILS